MRVLVTGAKGFVGSNLCLCLKERKDIEVVTYDVENNPAQFSHLLQEIDFVFHLAGVNRPRDVQEFVTGNVDLTEQLCSFLLKQSRKIPILYTSSIQAECDNPYGQSKLHAEEILGNYSQRSNASVFLFRLPNVFGKWCRPNYNSVVATFCSNIANGAPIQINDPGVVLRLVYIDDVIHHFLSLLDNVPGQTPSNDSSYQQQCSITPEYKISVGELAKKIRGYKESRLTLTIPGVGEGFDRALYATYLSYIKPENFCYSLNKNEDQRGAFVEVLKTCDSGQFSFFTAHPGVTRGGHYHHTKNEKFLVLKGQATFKFRHMHTNETYQLDVTGTNPTVVETVPGWTHDITNTGCEEMIVMLWANEIFDKKSPDTFFCPL